MLNVTLIPILDDNYCYLIQSGEHIGLVDVGEAEPVISYLTTNNITPTHLFSTHHHGDHINGVEAIKEKYNVRHIAAKKDEHRIPQIDQTVLEGDAIEFGKERFKVIETNGHTLNHINFYGENSKTLFSGDTLFVMGCGRLFEGTHAQMFEAFKKLKALPDETKVYCGHEYTLTNAEFCTSVELDNQDIINRLEQVRTLRNENKPTIPTTLAEEKKTNVFMRANDVATFKKYRDLKDNA